MYPEYMMQTLRLSRGIEADDTSMDDVINTMSPRQAFGQVCNYEGMIGCAPVILGWIESLYGIDLS